MLHIQLYSQANWKNVKCILKSLNVVICCSLVTYSVTNYFQFGLVKFSSNRHPRVMVKEVNEYRRMRKDSSLAYTYLMSSSANSLSLSSYGYIIAVRVDKWKHLSANSKTTEVSQHVQISHSFISFHVSSLTNTHLQCSKQTSHDSPTHLILTLQHSLYHSLIHISHIIAY